jgi:hypothetical protein
MPKYRVSLPPGGEHVFDADDEAQAIEKYNAWSGVISTDNEYAVGLADAPLVVAEKPKKGTK